MALQTVNEDNAMYISRPTLFGYDIDMLWSDLLHCWDGIRFV